MLKFAAIGLVAAIAAGASAQALIDIGHNQAAQDLRPAQQPAADTAEASSSPALAQPPAMGEAAQLVKSADGHYWADANVDGKAVHVLVDTGATTVALTADDARRLGFEPKTLNYNYRVTTANGPARAAKITLASVSVAGAEVQGVDAMVIDQGLQTSLLGMTYLGRLSQFEATPTSLILRP
ncbi:MAG: TIGR02281 family clan AA aspartic protease [Caulobacteraceae bacterium]|nr:TIGR02281 family clan AA aspartic protease [Caulobacteraceae bacterium]